MRVRIADGSLRIDIRTPHATPADLPLVRDAALSLVAALSLIPGRAGAGADSKPEPDAEPPAFGYSLASDAQLADQDDDVEAANR